MIITLLLPFITGTLNPVQMAINLGLIEGEITNERKFKNNGEPMEHGVKFGHKWYGGNSPFLKPFNNGKKIDFAGVSKSTEMTEASKE